MPSSLFLYGPALICLISMGILAFFYFQAAEHDESDVVGLLMFQAFVIGVSIILPQKILSGNGSSPDETETFGRILGALSIFGSVFGGLIGSFFGLIAANIRHSAQQKSKKNLPRPDK